MDPQAREAEERPDPPALDCVDRQVPQAGVRFGQGRPSRVLPPVNVATSTRDPAGKGLVQDHLQVSPLSMIGGEDGIVSPSTKSTGEQWSSVTAAETTPGVGLLSSPAGSDGLSFSA